MNQDNNNLNNNVPNVQPVNSEPVMSQPLQQSNIVSTLDGSTTQNNGGVNQQQVPNGQTIQGVEAFNNVHIEGVQPVVPKPVNTQQVSDMPADNTLREKKKPNVFLIVVAFIVLTGIGIALGTFLFNKFGIQNAENTNETSSSEVAEIEDTNRSYTVESLTSAKIDLLWDDVTYNVDIVVMSNDHYGQVYDDNSGMTDNRKTYLYALINGETHKLDYQYNY